MNVRHSVQRLIPETMPFAQILRLLRPQSFGDILSLITLIGLVLLALGYHRFDTEGAMRDEQRVRRTTDSLFDIRVQLINRRVDSLGTQLWFTNYMQCSAMTPTKRPEACIYILQRGPVQ